MFFNFLLFSFAYPLLLSYTMLLRNASTILLFFYILLNIFKLAFLNSNILYSIIVLFLTCYNLFCDIFKNGYSPKHIVCTIFLWYDVMDLSWYIYQKRWPKAGSLSLGNRKRNYKNSYRKSAESCDWRQIYSLRLEK